MVNWAYGVTTVPKRRTDLLPRTLRSLAAAGFDRPRLFVDAWEGEAYPGYELTTRSPRIRTFGNWMLAMAELYIRNPDADRFAIFQDDVLACQRLRDYLEHTTTHDKAYWNCICYPSNANLATGTGWLQSNQAGLGAQGLVFTNLGLVTLLTSAYTVGRPKNPHRGWRGIDGGIVSAMRRVGWRELAHYPSLLGHTGVHSSMGNGSQPQITAFLGESYDPTDGVQYAPPATPRRDRPRSGKLEPKRGARPLHRSVPVRRRP